MRELQKEALNFPDDQVKPFLKATPRNACLQLLVQLGVDFLNANLKEFVLTPPGRRDP